MALLNKDCASKEVKAALKAVAKAGIVVCAGIHMSDIPSFPYQIQNIYIYPPSSGINITA